MKKTWVTKYGYPDTRKEIEHDDDECAARWAAGSLQDGQFIEVEREDGSKFVRRVEGLGDEPGLHVNEYGICWTADRVSRVGCRIVSREQVDSEIADAKANGYYHKHEDQDELFQNRS